MTAVPLIDLGPAARELADLVVGIDDTELAGPTPCESYRVGDLLDHLIGVTAALRLAAQKIRGPVAGEGPHAPSLAHLPSDWRRRLAVRLDQLVVAWRDPAAWEGETELAGMRLPARHMGVIALDELVLHGWDLARATGQPFTCDDVSLEVVQSFTTRRAGHAHPGDPPDAGPVVGDPEDASPLERLVRLRGRDPAWTPC